MKPADIKRIAAVAEAHGERILEHFLPGGKRQGKEYSVLNPHRADGHTGSLSVEISTGRGSDFATGEAWGDYVGLVAFALQCKPGEAAEHLARFLGIDASAAPPPPTASTPKKKAASATTVVMPVPKDAPPPPQAHPTRGRPDVRYIYHDAEGRVLLYVCRWNENGQARKYFSPLSWTSDGWRWKGSPAPRPLYGLDRLAARLTAVVVVCEGEKAADAAAGLLPDRVCMSWMSGAQSADKADWSPLQGREVWIWPDADKSGTEAALKAAAGIRKAGAASVKFVNLDLFVRHRVGQSGGIVARSGDLPAGWDAADALGEGWIEHAVADLLKREGALLDELAEDADVISMDGDGAAPPKGQDDGGPFLLDEDRGLFYLEKTKHGDDWKVTPRRVCAPVTVPALGRDGESAGWSAVVEFRDFDGQRRQEIVPTKLLLGQGFDGIKLLADLGLEIEPGAKPLEWLKTYIIGSRPEKRARLVEQTGWHQGAFLFPDGAIGDSEELYIYRGNRRGLGAYATRGTLEQWQNVARVAENNPHLMFALSVAFAGPLLKLLGLPGAGFHWEGDSSIGKSGLLTAAGSVWGPTDQQVRSWRATSNALEYTAALHNDAQLILDELREVDGKEVGAIVYMLSNARGKGRAHHAGGLRDQVQWRIVVQSSGELGLADHMAAAGQKTFAGQEVRFVGLDADAGQGHGAWHDVSGCAGGGRQFTDLLKKSASRYYGTAGRAFVAALVRQLDDLPRRWRDHERDFSAAYKPDGAGGQVLRVMQAFALVAFAGEQSARWGVTTWETGRATAGAGALFRRWCRNRATTGNLEERQILDHVRALMERSWKSRFDDWHRIEVEAGGGKDGTTYGDLSRAPTVLEPLGFRRKDEMGGFKFYVFRQRFEREFAAAAGFKHRRVAAVLKAYGVLLHDEVVSTRRETLPNGDPRSYCLLGNVLWALGEDSE